MNENYNDKKVKEILESENVPERLYPENIKAMLDNTNAVKKRKQIKRSRVLKIVSAAAAFAIVCGTATYFAKPFLQNDEFIKTESNMKASIEKEDTETSLDVQKISSFRVAESYEDVYEHMVKPYKETFFEQLENSFSMGKGYDLAENEVIFEESAEEVDGAMGETGDVPNYNYSADSMVDTESAPSSEASDYSDTYNQEKGVLEADIVKTNGKKIFYATYDTINYVDIKNGVFMSSDEIDFRDFKNKYPKLNISDLYIYNDMLVVLGSCNLDMHVTLTDNATFAMFYDISGTPTEIGYYIQEGYYSDVRLTEDGYLYLVSDITKYNDYRGVTSKDYKEYIPQFYYDGNVDYCPVDCILIPTQEEDIESCSYTTISGLDLNSENVTSPFDMKTIVGRCDIVYCTSSNIYTTYESYYSLETEVTRFAIGGGNIVPQASGTINGWINDQFSLSEYNGYLRVATTYNVAMAWNQREDKSDYEEFSLTRDYDNYLYVLDMDMNIVGSINGFGLDETIQSVNFSGNLAYIVTFMQTDPLYAIDVSDPKNPVITDELKITGYSSYMQKWGEGMLLGFGAEADESTGWETGVKLSMFDNSEPDDLKVLDSVSLTGFYDYDGYSSSYDSLAINDRKALYIEPEKNVIAIPIERRSIYDGGTDLETSYIFYSFENGAFNFLGIVTGYQSECFNRLVYADGYYYALCSEVFTSVNAETFEKVDECTF